MDAKRLVLLTESRSDKTFGLGLERGKRFEEKDQKKKNMDVSAA